MSSFKFTATVFDDGEVITSLNSSDERYPAVDLLAAVTAIAHQTADALAAGTGEDADKLLNIMCHHSTPKENRPDVQ